MPPAWQPDSLYQINAAYVAALFFNNFPVFATGKVSAKCLRCHLHPFGYLPLEEGNKLALRHVGLLLSLLSVSFNRILSDPLYLLSDPLHLLSYPLHVLSDPLRLLSVAPVI